MEDYDFEMPTPCQHCGEIFDLNDGFGSEKWYPNTVICEECYRKEEAEIEEDDRWEDINNEISNALYGLDKEEGAWAKITDENRALIIQLVSNSCLICGKELDKETAEHGNGTCSEYCNAKYSGYPMPSDYSEGLQKLVDNCC